MRLTVVLATVGTLSIAWGSGATVQAQAQRIPSNPALDSLITREMAGAGVMGLGAAVIVNRRIAWMKGYGFSDYQRTKPFSPTTIMNIASISKPFTGVAMMRAVQEGMLSLDADVSTYLPFRVVNPNHPNAPITLRHLATHTSSIADRWEVYRDTYHYGGDSPDRLDRFLADYFAPNGRHYSRQNFLDAAVGARREYSNIGAALAGYIVERAYGEPLNVLTRRLIFAPLGMASTGWLLSEVTLGNHSTLFVSQNGLTIPIPPYGLTTYPDGGVRTTVEDLSKFFIAVLNNGEYQGTRILDAQLAAEMQRFQFGDANRPENYPAEEGNSGLFWRTKFNGQRVGHGGNDPGVMADMLADRSGEIAVIVMMNTSLSGDERRTYSVILNALWKYAESLRSQHRD
jgi:CubicO group peptidase (beta-lactamase class C family)